MNARALAAAFVLLAAGCGGDAPTPPNALPPNAPPPRANNAPPPAAAAAPRAPMPGMPAPKRKASSRPTAPVARDPRESTGDISDGPHPELSEAVVFLASRPDVEVRPRSQRPDTQYAVTASPTGSSSRLFVTPAELDRGPAPRPPEGFEAADSTPTDDDGRPLEIVGRKDGRTMRLVPGGTFRFGDRATVTLSPYYIDATEVTLNDWKTFGDSLGRRVPTPANDGDPGTHPATGIKLREAVAYAEWAGKQLPTEAQWELAARGTRSLPNVWGVGRPLWSRPRAAGQLTPVGSYPSDRSVYGVFDLAGNAREWTLDAFDEDVFSEANGSTDFDGPKRPRSPGLRAVRGEADGFSALAREGVDASERSKLIGFRCVLPAE